MEDSLSLPRELHSGKEVVKGWGAELGSWVTHRGSSRVGEESLDSGRLGLSPDLAVH